MSKGLKSKGNTEEHLATVLSVIHGRPAAADLLGVRL